MAKAVQHDLPATSLTATKKPKKAKMDRSLRKMFRKLLSELDLPGIKKPWMTTKSFQLLSTAQGLGAWVDSVLADKSCWKVPYVGAELMPVVAVDTETIGLDTRILTRLEQHIDAQGRVTWTTIWEVKAEIAGVCLSVDGITGVYIPINHEDGHNVSREDAHYHLQRLFDVSHLVFYNAKFDREVMRQTLAIEFRPYPYYEDVQVLQYINDPKADLEERKKRNKQSLGDGLKELSKNVLGIEQIELSTLTKVKADWFDEAKQKTTQRVQYAPFIWVPTEIAVWYAAADGICTWLLWEKLHALAQSRERPHRIDGETIDTLTWLERQRPLIDVEPLERVSRWHSRIMGEKQKHLAELAVAAGWPLALDDKGEVLPDSVFDVNSNKDLPELLYRIKGLQVVKETEKGAPCTDADALDSLRKKYPDDEFLQELAEFKRYVALHPGNLTFDPQDHTARIYLKQCVVAGGRFSGTGGVFEKDGGMGMNPQAIKTVEEAWYVQGRILVPDRVDPTDVEPHEESELDPSCFKEDKHTPGVFKKAPGIINNHIANFLGYSICVVPECTTCAEKFGILIEKGRLDAKETINLRRLFIAEPGWVFATTDYSNIEMRIAANQSLEPVFLKEFLEGSGDFHTLTAIAIFPEFSDPNTSKARKKQLRGFAKICNFQLLYGGTEFTIYTNLKPELPGITMEDAKRMFDDYWSSVPVFRAFCDIQIDRAEHQMTCITAFDRVINFKSLMDAEHLHVPTKEEMENFWSYHRARKKAKEATAAGNKVLADEKTVIAEQFWSDKETGVQNAHYYNKFLSKIQKVAVNIPLQGLAGDFMRVALNKIRRWATIREPGVQAVLRVHLSVHDEIDYSVKNKYAAFVFPRMTRLMKHRALHQKRGWPVPIEADTEYGPSWDVTYHATGDDGHKPSGWTDIAGMETYLPAEFEQATVAKLLKALSSPLEAHQQIAKDWLRDSLHPRAFRACTAAFEAKTDAERSKRLYAALQLHEYWLIDETPDDRDDLLETLEEYEKRCGLTLADRGGMPAGGYLAAVPLTADVIRPKLPILGPEPEPESPLTPLGSPAVVIDRTAAVIDSPVPATAPTEEEEPEVVEDESSPEALREQALELEDAAFDLFRQASQLEEEEEQIVFKEPEPVAEPVAGAPATVEPLKMPPIEGLTNVVDDDELLLPTPKRREKPLEPPKAALPPPKPRNTKGYTVLRRLSTADYERLKAWTQSLLYGTHTLKIFSSDIGEWALPNVNASEIPPEFVQS